jgi:hypothetical protein
MHLTKDMELVNLCGILWLTNTCNTNNKMEKFTYFFIATGTVLVYTIML